MKHRLFHLLPLARAAAILLLSVSALHAENGLRREVWHGLSAASEESLAKNRAFLGRPLRLTTSPAYYAAPDGADILASAISPSLGGTSFGARLRGYLTAPTTGEYLFWDGGGDTVAVYLSTDENPTGKRLIVAHRGRTAGEAEEGREPLKSAPVSLVAGRKYYLEILHTSDTGQDGLALFWQAPGEVRLTIPATALEPSTPPAPNPAGLTREFFPKLSGDSLLDLTTMPDFYRPPAVTEVITASSFGGFGQNYGVRLRGYLTAPASGDYVFWECGSGDVSVNLATDDTSTALHQSIRLNDRPNRKELAHHKGATEPGEWDKHRTQQSKPITLIAGKRYYLEVLFKTGEGPDHLAVAWQVPGGSKVEPLPLSALESYRRAPTDLDDDGMPDALERAAKLDPTDAADASGDLDGDGIFNDEEMRAGANPAVKDSVPGLVVDDLWSDAPATGSTTGPFKSPPPVRPACGPPRWPCSFIMGAMPLCAGCAATSPRPWAAATPFGRAARGSMRSHFPARPRSLTAGCWSAPRCRTSGGWARIPRSNRPRSRSRAGASIISRSGRSTAKGTRCSSSAGKSPAKRARPSPRASFRPTPTARPTTWTTMICRMIGSAPMA